MSKIREKHPSYGMLQFCRSSSSTPRNLFGSSLQHKETIKMYLREGSVERSLSTDWYMGDNLIAEVEMSQSQFAEAITSMNMGSGVPVTIRWLQKDGKIADCPFTDKKQTFEDEFDTHIKNTNKEAKDLIHEVETLFKEKKTLTKADKTAILSKLNRLSNDIGTNTRFIYTMFNEQMDKTVTEAKGEIEAFMQNRMFSIANQALVENKDTMQKEITNKNVFNAEQKDKLENLINDAINKECDYETDNITNKAWDFFENKAPQIVYDKIADDYSYGDFESFDDINDETVDNYLQDVINDYEEEHGNIRSYRG